jgi:hypothetical protein
VSVTVRIREGSIDSGANPLRADPGSAHCEALCRVLSAEWLLRIPIYRIPRVLSRVTIKGADIWDKSTDDETPRVELTDATLGVA